MADVLAILAALSLAAWIYLLLARRFFWRAGEVEEDTNDDRKDKAAVELGRKAVKRGPRS